jgi:hypothetical protein
MDEAGMSQALAARLSRLRVNLDAVQPLKRDAPFIGGFRSGVEEIPVTRHGVDDGPGVRREGKMGEQLSQADAREILP